MVEGDLEHSSDFVVLAEVCDGQDGVLHALFCLEVEGLHAAIEGGAVTDSRGGRAVDAHLG